ncbi:MAG: putative metal-dependent hydrolase [Saprospiraceae bacterium]|nr:putative metal-dependent hydrolase [Saprospiraceae bacterium]
METPNIDHLRYPIGTYKPPVDISAELVRVWINDIEKLPHQLRELVSNYSAQQFDTPYRPGGWTVRQVIHHVADSHMNAYIRFKWALTEDNPTIKYYFEDRWAELPEAKTAPVDVSLNLLEALHHRWVLAMNQMSTSDFLRPFTHPEIGNTKSLAFYCGLYAWHGKHHLEHVRLVK